MIGVILLCGGGNRQVLNCLALAVIGHQAQVVIGVDAAFVGKPALSLFDRLARVVKQGVGRRAAWIVDELFVGQALRVISLEVHAVHHQSPPAVVVQLQAELGVGQVFARRAMVAITFGGVTAGAEQVGRKRGG